MSQQQLDVIFHSLADSTRRDILRRISREELSVTQIAQPYDISMAAVSKHISVLENADLIKRRREGKGYMLGSNPATLQKIDEWMEFYRQYWITSFDKMDSYLTTLQEGEKNGGTKK